MEMVWLCRWNTCVSIHTGDNTTDVFAVVHFSLNEISAFTPPAHIGLNRCNVQNEEEVLDMYTLVHRIELIRSHMKQASLRVQFGTHCMRHSYTLFKYNLYKGYRQRTIIFTSSSVDGFFIKLYMNPILCAVYCGLMRQHSQTVE
jgi:hypothetical protein